eukprot:XP_017177493.1 PREDICTED: lutropin subunit beta isoform X3 [Mus musculus]
MGKGRLVPLPESACLSLCLLYSLTSPPVSFLLLCWESPPFPTFLFPLRPSSLKVLVGGSPSPPHAIGWVQSGQVLLPGATVTTSRFLGFPEKVRTMAGRTLALRYGPPWSPISETEVLGTWPNWHLTSSGVAHHWIPPASFPLPTLQALIPWTKNPEMAGQPFTVNKMGILDRLQPYQTITASDFTRNVSGYPHQKPVMGLSWPRKASHRDRASLPRVRPARPRPSQPYLGALSLTRESYGPLVHPLCGMDRICPVHASWGSPHRKPVLGLYSVPKAYCTENSRYGSARAELL